MVDVTQADREAEITLDVYLAGYEAMPDDEIARPERDEDLLTWGDLRKIRDVLARHRTEAVRPLVEALEAHIRNNEEPLEAMAEAMVAAIEAWKLNDEKAIDKAIHDGLARIAQSVASFTGEMLK